jgi:hypothetical protein
MIHYTVRELHTPTGLDVHVAHVQLLDAVTLDKLVNHIVARGSTVGRADIVSVLEDYHATIADLLMMGMSVVTPTACYRPGIRGTFAGPDDSFDPSRQRIVVNVRPGALLRKGIAKDGQVTKEVTDKARPVLTQCLDLASGTANEVLTPGGGIHLTGKALRFDAADPAQGVFFLAADGSATPADEVLDNRPIRLIVRVPALAAGTYRLEVRASFNDNGDIRSGQLEKTLTVS